ncbi:ABC transporter ATP-binding protein [Aquipuribacter nitratireducens]|uniref:ABC transporter ATP-binding protein n=1 Tax=Aquipuribacter nitratireducens TaxID=650104 RepID=A0ABW0GM95_9MICO
MAAGALTCGELTKRFGATLAVDRLELVVPQGSMFGLVGPNGAGKTTTLSMATGLLRPDAGRVLVHGEDVWSDLERAHRLLGVLPDGLPTLDRLSGPELVEHIGRLHGLPRAEAARRAADLLAVLDLTDAGRTLVVDYSAGMRKKVGLACALVHAPRVLVLDEPFEAVDPVSASTIRELLQRFTADGGTVVVSSHVMALVEQLCDHVAVIVAGRVVASGTLDEVRAGGTLEDRFVALSGGRRGIGEGLAWLASSSG